MINKRNSVTKSVTENYLEDISTKGYDFHWEVATNGYEICNEDTLVFDEDFHKYLDLPDTPKTIPEEYNKDYLLHTIDLVRNTLSVQELHPEPIDIKSPWLVEKGKLALSLQQNSRRILWKERKFIPTHQYKPLSIRTLHRQFASLNLEDGDTEVLAFANKYGLLGTSVTLAGIPPEQPSLSVRSDIRGFVKGESLHRWYRESSKIGVLLALWDLIHWEETDKLERIIIWINSNSVGLQMKWQYKDGQYQISEWNGREKIEGFGHVSKSITSRNLSPVFFDEYKKGEVISPARYYLGMIINNQLWGIRPKLVDVRKYEITYIPRTLLDAMWLLLVLEVQGKIRTGRCKYCGEWFDFERSNREYCNGNCRRLAFYHREKAEAKGGRK